MNIVMFTNTFTPHVGGVANSVASLSAGLRGLEHRVLVIAPEFPDKPPDEADVTGSRLSSTSMRRWFEDQISTSWIYAASIENRLIDPGCPTNITPPAVITSGKMKWESLRRSMNMMPKSRA
ncbi:hypothetical protein [Neorhizobium sp. LjRoot104]|uniref:hypothetical protein n=1 Tax=Neorhizobium sp. LjRoot104 TaxID=3342254 RepID=UPI003ECC5424